MRRRGLSSREESGSVALTFALSMMVLGGFVVATLVIGRQVLERRELQSAADALALGGAFSVEQLGIPLQTGVVLPIGPRNTRLPLTAKLEVVLRPAPERRVMVRVTANATLDTQQTWFSKRFLQMQVISHAQVNEQIYGEIWPAVTILIDGSKGMGDALLGSLNKSAFSVLAQLVSDYVGRRLPVRNGVVIFNDGVAAAIDPPVDNDNETIVQPILTALNTTVPTGQTNTTAGLERARVQMNTIVTGGRNVLLVSDGEPTLGGPCAPQEACHITEAEKKAGQVRNLVNGNPSDGVALFTVEIRRSNWDPKVSSNVMLHMAGQPMSAGNDPTMNTPVQNAAEIEAFLTEFTKSICAFGPLDPGPGAAAKDCRPRSVNPSLLGPPQRVFSFLRYPSGQEAVIPRVPNRDLVPNAQGFEYVVNEKGSFVVLTLASCQALGKDPLRRLVIRWDDPQLVEAPRPTLCCHATSPKTCP
jgi:hypothetical protein